MISAELLLVAFGLSVILCGAYLLLAWRREWLDHPNQRSSHQQPTPHGGGVAIMLSLMIAALLMPGHSAWQLMSLLVLALLLMVLGVADDRWGLSVKLRFAVYAACSGLFAWLLLQPFGTVGLLWLIPVTLAMLWCLNLYNFMDGIDGFAALQGAGAAAAAGWLAADSVAAADYAGICFLLAACHLGFLVWNWPPARLFMGDAGSIPTGFLFGGLALYGQISGVLNAGVWLILLAVFFSDATWTLLRRWRRGENITQAHREHIYQRLSRHWSSHLRVDIAFLCYFVIWLVPLAWWAQTFQQYALFPVILAYLPLLFCMAKTADLP